MREYWPGFGTWNPCKERRTAYMKLFSGLHTWTTPYMAYGHMCAHTHLKITLKKVWRPFVDENKLGLVLLKGLENERHKCANHVWKCFCFFEGQFSISFLYIVRYYTGNHERPRNLNWTFKHNSDLGAYSLVTLWKKINFVQEVLI